MNENLRIATDRVFGPASGVDELHSFMDMTSSPGSSSTNSVSGVSHVHSFVHDFTHKKLDPYAVRKLFDINQPYPYNEEQISSLFRLYGIEDDNKDSILSEIDNLLSYYFHKSSMFLPDNYTISGFSDQFFAPDSPRSLKATFADLFFYAESSVSWERGVLNFHDALWEAGQPDSPFSDPDSPFLGAESPHSVLNLGVPPSGAGSPQIESPLDQFAIDPLIPLALALGLFLFLFFRNAESMEKQVRECEKLWSVVFFKLVLLIMFFVSFVGRTHANIILTLSRPIRGELLYSNSLLSKAPQGRQKE